MRNHRRIIAVSLLAALSSCHTSSSSSTTVTPTTPTSTFNITVNGHSYHLSGNMSSNPPISVTATTTGSGTAYSLAISATDLNHSISASISAYKTDLSSALGTYYEGYDSSASGITHPGGQIGGYMTIIDYGDGGKAYTNQQGVYAGQISTVDVTVSNGSEVKGTFSLKLNYNGTISNITGDFDYKH